MPCAACEAPARAARRGLTALLVTLACAGTLAGCAPPPPGPGATRDLVRERHGAGVRARTERTTAEAEVLLWTEVRGQRLPGVDARLVLGSPDACRLRVRALSGTALDLSVFGDSLLAWIPPERAGVALDASGDSLGVREPGSRAWRTFAATWMPPDAAWAGAQRSDSGLVLTWREDGDPVTMRLDDHGRPIAIGWRGEGRRSLEVRYQGWIGAGGAAWPQRMTADMDRGEFRMSLRAQHWRFAGELGPRFTMPARARMIGRRELIETLRAWWDG